MVVKRCVPWEWPWCEGRMRNCEIRAREGREAGKIGFLGGSVKVWS